MKNCLSSPEKTLKGGIKCVVVGDGDVGKTSLVMRYSENIFPTRLTAWTTNNNHKQIIVDGRSTSLGVWDTAGQDCYDRLRPLSYPDTDIFLLCFSVDSSSSFNNIGEKWIPELRHYCPDVPIILVGTKIDLRGEESEQKLISREQGHSLSRGIGSSLYLECSALSQEGVQTVFEESARVVLDLRLSQVVAKKNKNWCICSII